MYDTICSGKEIIGVPKGWVVILKHYSFSWSLKVLLFLLFLKLAWSDKKNIHTIICTLWRNLRDGYVGWNLIAQVPDHPQTEMETISVTNCGLSVGQEKAQNVLVSCRKDAERATGKAKMVLMRYDAGDRRRDA